MKKVKLLFVVGVLGGFAAVSCAASFQEAPPPIGAYTLRGGEWQIGVGMSFLLLTYPYGYFTTSLNYGLTDAFQIGTGISQAVPAGAMFYSYVGNTKFRVKAGPHLDLGFSFSLGFVDRGFGVEFGYMQSGVAASARIGPNFAVHGGVDLGASKGGGWFLHPYALMDFDLLPNLKLVGKLGIAPLDLEVGAWLRLLEILDINLSLDPLLLTLSVSLYLRW